MDELLIPQGSGEMVTACFQTHDIINKIQGNKLNHREDSFQCGDIRTVSDREMLLLMSLSRVND